MKTDKLELRHLAGYLPYGLKMYWEFGRNKTIDPWELMGNSLDFALKNQNKPILRPLSDLTKEIEVNGEKFVPNINLSKGRVIEYENGSFWYLKTESLVSNKSGWQGAENQLELFQKLLEWHFDIYGLIEKGLAIDINTLDK